MEIPQNRDSSQALVGGFHGKRVLITGGAGFIGASLACRLVASGSQVCVADNLGADTGGNAHNLAGLEGRIQFARVDLRDSRELPDLVRGRDHVFALAGRSSHLDSMRFPERDLADNCGVALALLEACRVYNPAAVVVFAGTRQVYGRPLRLPVDEDHPTAPVDINGVHKLAADRYHALYHTVHGLRTRVLRLTNTIGPRMRVRDARQNFFGDWVRRALEGREIEVWGGAQSRDFTFVDDAVDAFLRLAQHEGGDGRVYNLGGGASVALRELAELVVDACGGRFVVKPFPSGRQVIDIGDYRADDRRFRAETGWAPTVGLPEAVARTLAYFRENLRYYV